MLRVLGASALTAALISVCGIPASEGPKATDGKTHLVKGTGDNEWVYNGAASNPAKVGDPAMRLEVKVKNGDLVHFEVTGNKHGVILENGKTQLKDGIIEVVKNPGELDLKDPEETGELSLPDY